MPEELLLSLVTLLFDLDLFINLIHLFDEPKNLIVLPFFLLGYFVILLGLKR